MIHKAPLNTVPGAQGLRPLAYIPPDAAPPFKLAMQRKDGRYYLYGGQQRVGSQPGVQVTDVTDPHNPRSVGRIPAPPNNKHSQIQVADDLLIASLFSAGNLADLLFGHTEPPAPGPERLDGIYVYDVARPDQPRLLSHFDTEHVLSHRHFYSGGRYVHLSSGADGFSGLIYRVVDIGDPARPREVGRWWLPEQWEAGGATPTRPLTWLHAPYVEGDRAYLSFAGGGIAIVDISRIEVPRLVSRLRLAPFTGWLEGHTAIPYLRRDLLVVNSEAIAEYSEAGRKSEYLEDDDQWEPMNVVALVDIRNERKPRIISVLPQPRPPADSPYQSYYEKGGRFGPHNQHQPQSQACLYQGDERLYVTWFNAGVRVYDISNPFHPEEIASFVPPDPEQRFSRFPPDLVTQTEDVIVDDRGYVYVSDINQGVYVLEVSD